MLVLRPPFAIPFILLAIFCQSIRAADAPTEQQKIESLIRYVESLDGATFIRNGVEYNARAAAEHMRTKWKVAGDRIASARDFIRIIATKSSQSGRPYIIRFKDGREVPSAEFLTTQLDKLEKAAP